MSLYSGTWALWQLLVPQQLLAKVTVHAHCARDYDRRKGNARCRHGALAVQTALNRYLQHENGDLKTALAALRRLQDGRFAADAEAVLATLSDAPPQRACEAAMHVRAPLRAPPYDSACARERTRAQDALQHFEADDYLEASEVGNTAAVDQHDCAADEVSRIVARMRASTFSSEAGHTLGQAHGRTGMRHVESPRVSWTPRLDAAVPALPSSGGGSHSGARQSSLGALGSVAYQPIQSRLQHAYSAC